MRVSLDSTAFPAAERVEAFTSAIGGLLPPPSIVQTAQDLGGVISATLLGPGMVLTGVDVAGDLLIRESRPPRGLRDSSVERVSIAAVSSGRILTDDFNRRSLAVEELRILDLSSPYRIHWSGSVHAVAFDLDCAALGVSVDAFRVAVARGTTTPMGDLLRRHLLQVAPTLEMMAPTELAAVGAATAQLLRGLVLAASDHDADRLEARASTLLVRIQDWVMRHLADRDLSPERIAATHNVSQRQLYLLFSQLHETPAEWVIKRRLEAAMVDLTYRPETVSATAQKWGFKDHSHFSRRFKATYGMTPRSYRQRVQQDAAP